MKKVACFPRSPSFLPNALRRPATGNLPRPELSSCDKMTRVCWVVDLGLAVGEGNPRGRLRRALRYLDSVGGQTADWIAAPLVPGRGRHGVVRRQCPPSRTTLRLGT